MARFYAFSIFILLVCGQKQLLCLSEDTISKTFGLNTTPMEIADNIWSEIKDKGDLSKVKALDDIKLKDYLGIQLNGNLVINYDPQDLPNLGKIVAMSEFEEPFNFIDEGFSIQMGYLENNTEFENDVDFRKVILLLLSNNSYISVDSRIYGVYKRLVDEEESVLDLIDRYLNKGFVSTCLLSGLKQQSLQQFYRNFSTTIKLVQAKYLIVKKTLCDIAEKYPTGIIKAIEEQELLFGQEDYKKFFEVVVNNGTRRIIACKLDLEDEYYECVNNITQSILKSAVNRAYENIKFMDTKIREVIKLKMKNASRNVWKCGAGVAEGETYTKLDNLFQGYFTNSPNTDKCSDSNKTDPCHFTRRCTGTLHKCKPIDLTHNDDYLRICTANKNSNYRYEYIEYGNPQDPKSYGKKKDCEFNSNMTKPISYCICEESRPDSDRYVSLVPAMAKENKVVTGARLIKINHTLYIQVQEGELGPEATIKNNTASWTPVKTVEPTKENIDKKLTHEIQWNSGKGVYVTERSYTSLDVAVAGLGFGETPEKDLFLQVYRRSFDFTTGKLLQNVVPFVFYVSREHSKILDLSNLDKPTRTYEIDKALPTNQFIDFSTTSLEGDIGQNTIPYIDIQDVTTDELTPISDAEIYYKNSEGYGGYLGLKLHTYNIEPHFYVKNLES